MDVKLLSVIIGMAAINRGATVGQAALIAQQITILVAGDIKTGQSLVQVLATIDRELTLALAAAAVTP